MIFSFLEFVCSLRVDLLEKALSVSVYQKISAFTLGRCSSGYTDLSYYIFSQHSEGTFPVFWFPPCSWVSSLADSVPFCLYLRSLFFLFPECHYNILGCLFLCFFSQMVLVLSACMTSVLCNLVTLVTPWAHCFPGNCLYFMLNTLTKAFISL